MTSVAATSEGFRSTNVTTAVVNLARTSGGPGRGPSLAHFRFSPRGSRAHDRWARARGRICSPLDRQRAREPRTLEPGERKYFCEIDCHLAYSVTGVSTARSLGRGARAATAAGTFYVVTVSTWFDPRTISSHRPLVAPLTPNPRRVVLVDERGRAYPPSSAGQRALDHPSVPLTRELLPSGSYETRLVFDLPAEARSPRLLLTDADPISALLIGHESGPLHRKVFFALPPATGP